MPTPRRCPCGVIHPAARRGRCPACGRVTGRRGVGPGLVLTGLVFLTLAAAGLGALAVRTRPQPPEPAAGTHLAPAASPAPPVVKPRAPDDQAPPPRSVGAVTPPALVVPTPAVSPERPAPAPAVPVTGRLAPEPAGRYRAGESFDQDVTVARRSAFRVLGAGAPQAAEYAFTSRLTVVAVGSDGGLDVTQRVENARLLACDPAARGAMEDALRKARGAAFRIAVGPGGEVTGLTGPADPVRVREGTDLLGGQTFRVWSLLDADGWKELAGLTFFQPDRPLVAGAKWARPLAHAWGPLGSWAGRTHYTAAGRRDGAERVEYAHEMGYRPPAGGGDLPFRVVRADFRPVAAGGVIRYDLARGRVAAAEEVFRVRGGLTVAAAGVEAAVEVEEWQEFRLRILEPGARALDGRGPSPR